MSSPLKLLGMLAALGMCTATFADIPNVRIDCQTDGGYLVSWYPIGVDNGDGSYSYSGYYPDPWGDWTLDLESLTVKSDPFISAVYGLTNNLGSTQNFTLTVNLPVSPQLTPSSLIGGSTGGSVTDADGNGVATLATIGPSPFYFGTIDGNGALPLYSHPYSISAPFAGGTATIPAASAGLPGPTLAGPAVLSDIGITHRFSLTSHDSVGITSYFQAIQYVPEPAAALLVSLLALVSRRR